MYVPLLNFLFRLAYSSGHEAHIRHIKNLERGSKSTICKPQTPQTDIESSEQYMGYVRKLHVHENIISIYCMENRCFDSFNMKKKQSLMVSEKDNRSKVENLEITFKR